LCGNHVSKRPYGELGSVDRGTCLCCVSAESAFGPISPGCGCEEEKVDDIVNELKTRMRQRGDTAQINRAEETLRRLDEVDAKLVRQRIVVFNSCFQVHAHKSANPLLKDAIIDHLNIPKTMKMDDRTT